MLKPLAFALSLALTAAACKTDNAPAHGSAEPAATPTQTGPAARSGPARSGKIELPARPPSLPASGDGAAQATGGSDTPGGNDGDDRRARRRERMMTIDTDGDGVISDEEREAARQRREADMLARLDKDGDGKISDEERAAGRRERADEMRTRLDTNGDGKVTAEELAAGRRMRGLDMQEVDTNGDGDISAEELEAAMRNRVNQRWGGQRWSRDSVGTPPTTR